MFVYEPALLMITAGRVAHQPRTRSSPRPSAASASPADCSATFCAKRALWERVLLLAAALLLIKPGLITDLIGLVLLAIVVVNQKIVNPVKPGANSLVK